MAVIENNEIVPYSTIESGYIRYKDKVYKIKDLNIEECYVGNDYHIIVIAPFHSCTIIEKNDKYIERLQNVDELNQSDIYKLKKQIHMNRANDVSMSL